MKQFKLNVNTITYDNNNNNIINKSLTDSGLSENYGK